MSLPDRFQFSVRNMLAATFWVCVCLGTYNALPSVDRFMFAVKHNELAIVTNALLILICFTSPFLAVASLFGRPLKGWLIGVAMLLVVFVVMLLLGQMLEK